MPQGLTIGKIKTLKVTSCYVKAPTSTCITQGTSPVLELLKSTPHLTEENGRFSKIRATVLHLTGEKQKYCAEIERYLKLKVTHLQRTGGNANVIEEIQSAKTVENELSKQQETFGLV